jgi:hypothetical protein
MKLDVEEKRRKHTLIFGVISNCGLQCLSDFGALS